MAGILIGQKKHFVPGLPQLGSSEIGIKVKVPFEVVCKFGIAQFAAEGDAHQQFRCHPPPLLGLAERPGAVAI